MIRPVLVLLNLLSPLLRLAGADPALVRRIVRIQLICDNRRSHAGFRGNRRGKREMDNTFSLSLLFNTLFGIFWGVLLVAIPDRLLALVVIFSVIMILMIMLLISDFVNLLFDTRENTIYLSRPVDSRTLAAARIIHAAVYLMLNAFAYSLTFLVIGGIKFGLLFLAASFAALLLAILMVLFLVMILYFLLLRWLSGEKFRDIVAYFQIATTMLFIFGYQIGSGILRNLNLEETRFAAGGWLFLYPPAWFAQLVEGVYSGFTRTGLAYILPAVLVPLGGMWLIIRTLAPGFNRKLAQMAVERGEKPSHAKRSGFAHRLSRLFCKSLDERASFLLAWHITARDRKFKVRVFPSFGFIIFAAYMVLMPDKNTPMAVHWQELPATRSYLALIYISLYIILMIIPMLAYSDQPEASWIFRTLPVARPGDVLSGTIKAVFIKLFIPFYIFISLGVLYIWKGNVINDLFLGLASSAVMTAITALMHLRAVPFSKKMTAAQSSGRFLQILLFFLIFGFFWTLHYLLARIEWLIWLLIPLLVLLGCILFSLYRTVTWGREPAMKSS